MPCVAKKSKKDPVKNFNKEIDLLETVNHPCIAKHIGSYFDKTDINEIYIFYEYLEPAKNLILKNNEKDKLSPFQRVNFVYQILSALIYLEGKNIFHGDIKLDNVLYDRKANRLKLCIFIYFYLFLFYFIYFIYFFIYFYFIFIYFYFYSLKNR